jgi:cytochrome d ubiquinol oxidase subunit I
MGPSGFVALLAGWFVTETGRQPYTVYGLLRTADSVSPIGSPGVALSLLAFVVVYLVVFGMGVWYLLRLMRADPEAQSAGEPDVPLRAAGVTPIQAMPEVEHGGTK